jgi:hypothetical protein
MIADFGDGYVWSALSSLSWRGSDVVFLRLLGALFLGVQQLQLPPDLHEQLGTVR